MSRTHDSIPPRLIDLMVEHATQGLSPQDELELQAALAEDETLRKEAEAYALAATAVELALTKPQTVEALPHALRDKLISASPKNTPAPPLGLSGTAADKPAAADKFSFTDGRMFGWYAAAAALIALCAVLLQPNTVTLEDPRVSIDVDRSYQALAQAPDTVTATWGFNADPEAGADKRYANATGEVIWNTRKQAGYMKLAGLPVNDPTEIQYQLWIVDPTRDAEPIDGGVFDITATGETIVPIDAKLRAEQPVVFAITVEQPGGVVVSEGPLQVVAAVEKS